MSKGKLEQKSSQDNLSRLTDWCGRIGIKSLSTGNFGWFVVLILCLGVIWKLDGPDLKEVLLSVLNGFYWVGWAVSPVTVYVCIRIVQWQGRIHENEMNRISEVKNTMVQKGFELPLQSTKDLEKQK